ncbi:hypothetical protein [Spartinivicinus marinus]|nr:hypothetical protein [Spartinivicinus marinus]MCX4026975.1 hypothetical protein [Spartinivicinus marinus]
MLIGITGKARAGKDTFANYLQEQLPEYNKYAIADPIKQFINDLFWKGLNTEPLKELEILSLPIHFLVLEDFLEPILKALNIDMKLRDMVLHFINAFGAYEVDEQERRSIKEGLHYDSVIYQVSPRKAYQLFGTEVCRHFDQDFWLKPLNQTQNTIITDVRLNREAEYIKNRGGVIIEVVRNNTPKVENHITEQGISKNLIDLNVSNTSLEALQDQAKEIAFMLSAREWRHDCGYLNGLDQKGLCKKSCKKRQRLPKRRISMQPKLDKLKRAGVKIDG